MNNTTTEVPLDRKFTDCLYGFGLSVGLSTQIYVTKLIVAQSGKTLPSEFFSFNLSICEILNFLNCLFLTLAFWFPSFNMLAQSMSGLGITACPLFDFLICVVRYLALVHLVIYLKYKPLRYRVICSTTAWIISIGSCFATRFLGGLNNIFGHALFFTVQFLVFLSIQMFCCPAVLRVLKQSGPGERGREGEEENQMKKRAFHLILIITVNIVSIYVPVILTGLVFILIWQNIAVLWQPSTFCYVLAGFVHPVLYLYRAGKLSWFSSV